MFKRFDFYQTNIAFRENGGDSFGSNFGACTSLIITIIVALYTTHKFVIMRNYDDTQYSEYLVKKGLSDGEYGQDLLQFQVAFSVFDF